MEGVCQQQARLFDLQVNGLGEKGEERGEVDEVLPFICVTFLLANLLPECVGACPGLLAFPPVVLCPCTCTHCLAQSLLVVNAAVIVIVASTSTFAFLHSYIPLVPC